MSILMTGILCLFMSSAVFGQQEGRASYYSDALKGRKMANGERYDPDMLTCAHRDLPFGSILKIALKNDPDHSVMVTVTDRGPYVKGRIVDLSKAAAREIGLLHHGVAEVVVAVVKMPGMDEPAATGIGGGGK